MKKPTRNLPTPTLQTDPANPTRRRFLRTTAASVVAATTPSLLFTRPAYASARTIKIGFVNPRTAMLAPFGEGEDFVLAGVRKLLTKGLIVNGAPHPVEIIDKDSASDPTRAADLASALIKSDKVDLMLAASTAIPSPRSATYAKRIACLVSPPILPGRSTSWDEAATSIPPLTGPIISSGAWKT